MRGDPLSDRDAGVRCSEAMQRSLAAAIVAVGFAAACASAAPDADITKGQIRADLKEYAVPLTSTTVRAGQVTFIAPLAAAS